MVERQSCLNDPCDPGRRDKVTDHRFHRPHGAPGYPTVGRTKDASERPYLRLVPDRCSGPVGLEDGHVRGVALPPGRDRRQLAPDGLPAPAAIAAAGGPPQAAAVLAVGPASRGRAPGRPRVGAGWDQPCQGGWRARPDDGRADCDRRAAWSRLERALDLRLASSRLAQVRH